MSAAKRREYLVVAIVLHWTIAIAIFGQIALGWWMGEALADPSTRAHAVAAFQLHKSFGLTVLALSLARLALRFVYPPPPLPKTMKGWERIAAAVTHWLFYGLMIALPLTGWLYVSTGWSAPDNRPLEVPTLFFGLVEVPHLLGLSQLGEQVRARLASVLEFSHSKLAWAAIVLTALHVGAALKHHFIDGDDVLARMAPGVRPRDPALAAPRSRARAYGLAGGIAAMAAALGLSVWAFVAAGAAPKPDAMAAAAPAPSVGAPSQTPAEAIAPAPSAAPVNTPAPSATAPSATADASAPWVVDYGASAIAFTGSHAGTPFRGRFERWRAEIVFDPEKLEAARARVTIETGSAADGVSLHDQTLPQEEWFNTADYPNALFEARDFRRVGEGAYEARGRLTIKDRSADVVLPFTLAITQGGAEMSGRLQIDRAAFDLGQRSDPDGEFVSTTIGVDIRVRATRP